VKDCFRRLPRVGPSTFADVFQSQIISSWTSLFSPCAFRFACLFGCWYSFAFADFVRPKCRVADAWLGSCLSEILLATCFLATVQGVLFCMLRVRRMLFFSRLYLSSTGLVSVHDKYNLEKLPMAHSRL